MISSERRFSTTMSALKFEPQGGASAVEMTAVLMSFKGALIYNSM
jgi:hypothetical protein